MKIINIEQIPDHYIERDAAGLVTKALGAAAGSGKIYVNVDCVPPNAYSTKYHSHSQQEEFFLILSGTGLLRLNNEEHRIQQGDCIAKLPGQHIAHTFYNDSDAALCVLDIGTNEKEDTCYYPDEDVYLLKSNGQRRVFKGASQNLHWTAQPNEET